MPFMFENLEVYKLALAWVGTGTRIAVALRRTELAPLGDWIDVPDDVDDAHAYAIQYAAERLNSRGEW